MEARGRGESGSDFFVSALVVMLVIGIVTIKFSGKLFRPEATLAVVLTVVTVAGWIWRMPRGWFTISQIAWRYRLKTCQVREVADKLGMRPFNRGALVPPAQRKKMHPELMRLKKRKAVREPSVAKGTDWSTNPRPHSLVSWMRPSACSSPVRSCCDICIRASTISWPTPRTRRSDEIG